MRSYDLSRDVLEAVAARMAGRQRHQKSDSVADRKLNRGMSLILLLPELALDPIQDTNPASPTFGQFLFMLDYDSLP